MGFKYVFNRKAYVKKIDAFIKRKGITRVVFCEAINVDRSYLSKLARGLIEEPSRKTDATIQAVLKGKLKLPEPALRKRSEPKPVIKFCPEDHDVTELIKQAAAKGEPITYQRLKQLCVAHFTMSQIGK